MPGVQRSGRVGADELDVDPHAGAEGEAGVAVDALVDDLDQHVVQPAVGQVEVDEAGAGHLDRAHVRRAARR